MSTGLDPVTLQVMLGGLRAVCEEMGAVLVRAAHSANIKERRDASTALFDADGQMVMQAEHIPVHLGAMPDAVAAVLDEDHAEGDAWILNDPYRGGTHLPDITLVSPLFRARRPDRLRGDARASRRRGRRGPRQHAGPFPAPRGGGRRDPARPASHAAGRSTRVAWTRWSRACAGPASAPRTCARSWPPTASRPGASTSSRDRHGDDVLARAMSEVLAYAERRTRAAIAAMPDGRYEATDILEDDGGGEQRDLRIRCEVRIAGDELEVDFAGSAPQSDGNLNCPLSVTKSAVYYVVRVLTDPDIPPSAARTARCTSLHRPARS